MPYFYHYYYYDDDDDVTLLLIQLFSARDFPKSVKYIDLLNQILNNTHWSPFPHTVSMVT